ncbi:MAG TPA: FkbM family methyltransferase [Solirubrobacterales bacterium]
MELVLSRLKARGGWSGAEGNGFLDIGANIGTATVTAFREGAFAEAICFEPLPDNHRLLLENLAENGLADRVQTMNVALSDHDGEADFEVSPNNSGDGRVRVAGSTGGANAFGEETRQIVKVRLARLDTACEEGLIDLSKISLAWIDAQGHEGQILTGAKRLMRSSIPLVTEVWPYGLKRSGGREAFIEGIRANYEWMIDLGRQAPGSSPVEIEANQVEALLEGYEKSSFFDPDGSKSSTDLLLL